MAEKATLIEELPPIAKKSGDGDKVQAQSKTSAEEKTTGTEVQPDTGTSITPLQATTYGSYVSTFVIAGFASVILYRKALENIEKHFAASAKILAAIFALTSLYGFFAAYSYSNYLKRDDYAAPLSLTILVWMLIGISIGYATNRLSKKNVQLKISDVVIDATLYVVIFGLTTVALSPDIGPNTALVFSLLAALLVSIPLSRGLLTFQHRKTNRSETQRKREKILIKGLTLHPALLPVLALLYLFGACSADLVLILINLITLSFIVTVSFAMLACIKGSKDKLLSEASATEDETQEMPTMDPLVAELLAEQAEIDAASLTEDESEVIPEITSIQPPAPQKPKALPKQTPAVAQNRSPKPEAPRKPEKLQKETAPSPPPTANRVKAPAKPKKRF